MNKIQEPEPPDLGQAIDETAQEIQEIAAGLGDRLGLGDPPGFFELGKMITAQAKDAAQTADRLGAHVRELAAAVERLAADLDRLVAHCQDQEKGP